MSPLVFRDDLRFFLAFASISTLRSGLEVVLPPSLKSNLAFLGETFVSGVSVLDLAELLGFLVSPMFRAVKGNFDFLSFTSMSTSASTSPLVCTRADAGGFLVLRELFLEPSLELSPPSALTSIAIPNPVFFFDRDDPELSSSDFLAVSLL